MNLSHPLQVIAPTLDAEVLEILARADASFTGLQVRDMIRRERRPSHRGVDLVLERLQKQGIVISERVGRARRHKLNRGHLAADHIVALAGLRLTLIERMRAEIEGWAVQPVLAALFGSTARNDSDAESDIDVFVVRPTGLDPDDEVWLGQHNDLSGRVSIWTGNDARILEYGLEELPEAAAREEVIASIRDEAVILVGERGLLRRRP